MNKIRLQKFLSQAGVASRRGSETLIKEGRVRVNGETATLGDKIDPDRDKVEVDGISITLGNLKYYLLNKPKGYTCTRKDRHAEHTIFELLPDDKSLHNVGRLDKDTEGLILVTNDGELTQKLTHPSHEVIKAYQALVKGRVTEEELTDLIRGVDIEVDGENYRTLPAKVKVLNRGKRTSTLLIAIREGRKRQVRLMCDAIGHPVVELKRVSEDFLTLKGLETGEYRALSAEEVERLKRA